MGPWHKGAGRSERLPKTGRGDVGERGIGGRPVQKEKRVSILVGGPRPYESAPSTLGSANAQAGVVSDGVAWGVPGFEAPRGGSSERVGLSASPGRWSKSKTRRSVGARRPRGFQHKSERGSQGKWKGHRVARYRVQGGSSETGGGYVGWAVGAGMVPILGFAAESDNTWTGSGLAAS